jgi:hypothetical protein
MMGVDIETTRGDRDMARKKVETPKMPVTEAKPELKIVRLELPREYHRLLRMAAAADETNMALMARKFVMEALDKRKGGGK